MDCQIGDLPHRASRAGSVPHNSLCHSANDEFLHGCPSFESPMLSQQRHAAFPSERDSRAERCGSGATDSGSEARADAVCRRLQPVVRPGPRVMCAFPQRAPHAYWSTSSASTRRCGGMVISSARAAFRLMTYSNVVACSRGSSAGFAPLRILSTNLATPRLRRKSSAP